MAIELRKTGISVVGDMPWGIHFCCFYETKEDLLDILVPYFKVGLENNEFCLWVISSSELLTVEEATSALRKARTRCKRVFVGSKNRARGLKSRDAARSTGPLRADRLAAAP